MTVKVELMQTKRNSAENKCIKKKKKQREHKKNETSSKRDIKEEKLQSLQRN